MTQFMTLTRPFTNPGGGEVIRHFYEVSNLGPQTIGGVELRVAWPTEDEAGRAVSALEGVPFVRYKGPTADYTDECEIKGCRPRVVNG